MMDWDARADAKELLDLAIKQLENEGYAIFSPQDIDWFPKDPEEARKKWQFSTTFQHGDTVWEPSESNDKCLHLTAEEIREIREEEYREGYMEGIKHIPVWNKCQAPGCEFDSFIYREEKGGDQWLYHKGYKIKLECLEELPKEERL